MLAFMTSWWWQNLPTRSGLNVLVRNCIIVSDFSVCKKQNKMLWQCSWKWASPRKWTGSLKIWYFDFVFYWPNLSSPECIIVTTKKTSLNWRSWKKNMLANSAIVLILKKMTQTTSFWVLLFPDICHYWYINYSTGHSFQKQKQLNLLLNSTTKIIQYCCLKLKNETSVLYNCIERYYIPSLLQLSTGPTYKYIRDRAFLFLTAWYAPENGLGQKYRKNNKLV